MRTRARLLFLVLLLLIENRQKPARLRNNMSKSTNITTNFETVMFDLLCCPTKKNLFFLIIHLGSSCIFILSAQRLKEHNMCYVLEKQALLGYYPIWYWEGVLRHSGILTFWSSDFLKVRNAETQKDRKSENQKDRNSESQKVRKSESLKDRMSESQNVRMSECQ